MHPWRHARPQNQQDRQQKHGQKQAPRCGLEVHGPDPARLYKVSLGAERAVPQLYILPPEEGRPIGSEIQSSKVWVALGRGQADGFWKDGGHCSLVIPRLFFSTSLSCFSVRDKWVCYSHNVQERLSGSSNNSNSTSKNNVDGKRRYKHIINSD